MSISGICQAVRIGCNLGRLVEDYSKRENMQPIEKTDLAFRIAIFTIELGVFKQQMAHSSCEKIKDLRQAAFVFRLIALPSSLTKIKANPRSKITSLEFFLHPLIGLARSFHEMQQKKPLDFCSTHKEEYSLSEDSTCTDQTEVESEREGCCSPLSLQTTTSLNFVEITLETNMVSQGVGLTTRVKNKYMKGQDKYDLLALDKIPAYLHEDQILSKYVCIITKAPIRYVVGDPNRRTLYEKANITQWLREHNTSPVTRKHLTAADLVPLPAVQSLIDSRLTLLSKLLMEANSSQNTDR